MLDCNFLLFNFFQHSVHRYKEYRENDRVRRELDSVEGYSAHIVYAEAVEKSVEVSHKKTDVNEG